MIAHRIYRMALVTLPTDLRAKHGSNMEALFARELEQARPHGRLPVAITVIRGVWDVLVRAAYEQLWKEFGAVNTNPSVPTTVVLLRGHAVAFTTAFVVLTSAMLLLSSRSVMPALAAQGASARTVAEVLLLSLPFIAALSIPMAVLLAVLTEFSRLGANGALHAARSSRGGVRRLVVPVLAAATGVAMLAFVVTTEVVPRTNERLTKVLHGGLSGPNARTMTIGQLREAARNVPPGNAASARIAMFEVEVQKKLALPAACIVMALAGMAIAFLVPRGGAWLVVGASLIVFVGYYATITSGEALADRQVLSPFVAMWGANILLSGIALLLMWKRSPGSTSDGSENQIDEVVLRG